jgi:NAD(P)H-flavin reductase
MARIVRIHRMVPDNHLFQLRFIDEAKAESWDHRPGQFIELSVIGTGEAPISISSSPTRRGILELCVRRVGRLTNALYRLPTNALVGIRGPYGNGFPVEEMEGNDLLIIAGGLGMAPLRSLLWYALDNREKFDNITLMYGARTPADMLFREELLSLADVEGITTLLSVERDPAGTWKHHMGLLTTLFQHARIDPNRTYAAVVGPPVVYKFVLAELMKLDFHKDRILMSLERRMKCGVGKCGHCGVGYKYTCIHGPVFTYWDAINLPEIV